jgi:hypothetical protein
MNGLKGELGPRAAHLCIDMQRLFSREGPWPTPWMDGSAVAGPAGNESRQYVGLIGAQDNFSASPLQQTPAPSIYHPLRWQMDGSIS